ncbi:MAG: hypothetical protein ABIP55_17160 [Tepidisphaeraceae bacterium]
MIDARALVAILAAFTLAIGCGQKKDPSRTGGPPADALASPAMSDTGVRMSELRQRAQELADVAARMPGRNAAEDRQLAAQAFEKAVASLELLAGPQPGGAFRQQLRIIGNTRNVLKSAASDLSTDPAVDSGLRSVQQALVGVRERLFPDNDKVRPPLDALAGRVNELDSVRGPLHSLVAAQAFEATSKVIDTMAQEMEGRADATSNVTPPPPSPPPATQP